MEGDGTHDLLDHRTQTRVSMTAMLDDACSLKISGTMPWLNFRLELMVIVKGTMALRLTEGIEFWKGKIQLFVLWNL